MKRGLAQVQFEAQHYTEEDWDAIRAKLEANAELIKNVLGKELLEEYFAKKMVELVNQRKKFFAEERAKARRTTKVQLKRYGEEFQTEISKKQRIDDKDVSVDAEVKEEEPVIRIGKRKKQKVRKGINVDKSPQGDSETDEEESVEAMNPTPLDTKSCLIKALMKVYSSEVTTCRKFLRALHPNVGKHKVTTLKKEKVGKEIVSYFKGIRKDLVIKELLSHFLSSEDDKSNAWRCGDPNHLIRECPKPPRDKNQRAFVGGSWSDSGEEDDEKIQDETCLVAQALNEEISVMGARGGESLYVSLWE
ncbi:hypothetical protein Tco_0323450 [Tanacetum coccineum]